LIQRLNKSTLDANGSPKKKKFTFPEAIPEEVKQVYLKKEREKPSVDGKLNQFQIDHFMEKFEEKLKEPKKTSLRELRLLFSQQVEKKLAEEAEKRSGSMMSNFTLNKRNQVSDSDSNI